MSIEIHILSIIEFKIKNIGGADHESKQNQRSKKKKPHSKMLQEKRKQCFPFYPLKHLLDENNEPNQNAPSCLSIIAIVLSEGITPV